MPNKLIQNACGDANAEVRPEQLAAAEEIDAACSGIKDLGDRAGLPGKQDKSRSANKVAAPIQQIGRTLAWERFLRKRTDVAAFININADDAAELVDIDVALAAAEEGAGLAVNALTDGILITDGALMQRTAQLQRTVELRAADNLALKTVTARLRQLQLKRSRSEKARAATGRRQLSGYHAAIAGNKQHSEDLKVREALSKTSLPLPDNGGKNHGKR